LDQNNLSRKTLCKAIYHFLFNDKDLLEFGSYKVILITAFNDEREFNFHPNILVSNNTTFNQYQNKIINKFGIEDYTYQSSDIDGLFIRVWNKDESMNQHLKITRNAVNNKFKFSYTNRSFNKENY
jgi:sarcosine oxidase delta subunit